MFKEFVGDVIIKIVDEKEYYIVSCCKQSCSLPSELLEAYDMVQVQIHEGFITFFNVAYQGFFGGGHFH